MKRIILAVVASLWASSAFAVACQYRTTLPTLTDQTGGILQCDSSGRLLLGIGTPGASPPGSAGNPISVASVASQAYATSQVSVANTATLLIASRSSRNAVIITNMGTTPVFTGGSGVTAGNGGYLAGVIGTSKVIPFNGAIYGIVSSGSVNVSIEEIY